MIRMKEARHAAWGRGVDDGPPESKGAAPAKSSPVNQVIRHTSNTPIADTRQQHVDAVAAAFVTIANAEINRVESYISAGEHLVAAKAAGAHGTWRTWLAEHFPQSEDMAERAMACWHHRDALRDESARVRNFSLRKAMEFIKEQRKPEAVAAPSSRRPSRPVSRRALQNKVKYLEEKLELKQAALDAAEAKLTDQPAEAIIIKQPAIAPVATSPTLKELRNFEDAVDAVLNMLNISATVKVPQIHTQRAAELLTDIDAALEKFNLLREKIAGIAVGGIVDEGRGR